VEESITDKRRQKTGRGKFKVKKKHKQRRAVKPPMKYIDSRHRFRKKYLSRVFGENLIVMMATAGCNFKGLLRKLEYFEEF
jgi:hypothetical protein